MKRTLAILLSVLMLATCFVLVLPVYAEDNVKCEFCGKLHNVEVEDGNCYCCRRCVYLDTNTMNTDRLTQCAKSPNGHYKGDACCEQCTGIFPCNCANRKSKCKCQWCSDQNQNNEEPYKEVVSERAKTNFSSIMQNVLKKLSSVFDRLFDAAFAVFRIKK